ncbi:MAG: hypothetical protein CUN49_06695 [Candidatus Thermofonsia Clade 1 bacterium]|uniref:STAS/SEC14 domain-containing protein n=1 Tax=Candidatus Thermofonsia Clade 1 bacterium TaxID=2364210 RepID=A0A2M8PF56_9CHLR|nr:MAG: hypothetical protein CUN49_06695 [Candidatus Thermofonsia Clade 1 bacterium]
MGYSVDWLIKDRLILLNTSGDISIEEIEAIDRDIIQLLEAGQAPVHILADMKELGKFPFDLISMRRAATYLNHPKLGLIMAYGVSRIAASFAQLLTQLAGVRLRFSRDYAEAVTSLAAEDAHIKALLESGKLPAEK